MMPGDRNETIAHGTRAALAAYFSAGRHRDTRDDRAKPIRQIAGELGLSVTTVRRWLKCNHRDIWQKFWHAR